MVKGVKTEPKRGRSESSIPPKHPYSTVQCMQVGTGALTSQWAGRSQKAHCTMPASALGGLPAVQCSMLRGLAQHSAAASPAGRQTSARSRRVSQSTPHQGASAAMALRRGTLTWGTRPQEYRARTVKLTLVAYVRLGCRLCCPRTCQMDGWMEVLW